MLQRALDTATLALHGATLGLVGECVDVIRPCSQRRIAGGAAGWSRAFPFPTWSNTGELAGWPCSCSGDDVQACGCGAHHGVVLPNQPVVSVDEVLVDGVEVTDFVVLDAAVLVRGDGTAWPCCQYIERDPSEVGTWQVSYTWGVPVPADGVTAVAVLACELAKAWANDETCRLPKGTTTVTYEGASVQVDGGRSRTTGRFGIEEVDHFVNRINPHGISRQGKVLNPDLLDKPRRVTFP